MNTPNTLRLMTAKLARYQAAINLDGAQKSVAFCDLCGLPVPARLAAQRVLNRRRLELLAIDERIAHIRRRIEIDGLVAMLPPSESEQFTTGEKLVCLVGLVGFALVVFLK